MGRGEVMGPGKPGRVQQLCKPKQVPANSIIYFLQDWSCLAKLKWSPETMGRSWEGLWGRLSRDNKVQ